MPESFHMLIGPNGEDILWWQMALRSAGIFLLGLLLIRAGARRMFGRNAPLDMITAVIIGSVLSRTITGNAPFLPTLAAATTLVFLHWAVAVLSYHSDFLSRLTKGRKRRLIRDGEMEEDEMRAAKIGEEDLLEALRLHGFREARDVDQAYIERGGEISAVPRRPPEN